jgi:hypothetical protein
MPFFTPEQVAQAYIGPGAGYLSELEKLQARQAEARKLEVQAAREKKAEQQAALMDINKIMSTSQLGTGTQFDDAFKEKSQKFYNRWTTGEGRNLYNTDPNAWRMSMQQDANNSVLGVKANYEKANSLLDQQLKVLSGKYNNAIMPYQVKSTLINRLKLKNNGQYPDMLHIEDQDMNDLLAGRINADGTEATSPVQQRANQTLYADPDLLGQQVRKKYLDTPKVDITPIPGKRGGIETVWEGKIGPYDTVDPKTKKVITDTEEIQIDGKPKRVLSDRAFNKFMSEPDNKYHLAFYEQEELKNPYAVEFKSKVDDATWLKALATNYVKEHFPAEQTIKEKVDEVGAAQRQVGQFWANFNKKDRNDDNKPAYINVVKSSIAPGVPRGAIKVDAATFREQNGNITGVDFDNLYDITDVIGKADLKNRKGYPTRVIKDAKTGRVFITSKDYFTAAGNPMVPMNDNNFTTDPNQLKEINPKDMNIWVNIANPQDYGHKTLEDFTQYFDPNYNPGTTANQPAQATSAASAANAPAQTGNIDWSSASKRILNTK